MPRPTGPTDPNLVDLVRNLKKRKDKFYLALARQLEKSRRSKREVSLDKINKHANEGESVVVPGKVLDGELTKKVDVYAWNYSKNAREKITRAGGKCLTLDKLLETKEKGRILI